MDRSCPDYENPDTAVYYSLRLTAWKDKQYGVMAELVDAAVMILLEGETP